MLPDMLCEAGKPSVTVERLKGNRCDWLLEESKMTLWLACWLVVGRIQLIVGSAQYLFPFSDI